MLKPRDVGGWSDAIESPVICIHMCKVTYVSRQAASGSEGHAAWEAEGIDIENT